MKTRWRHLLLFIGNPHEKDLFRRTQGRLTRIYSGLLILFLVLFIAIVYTVLHFVIMKNQEQELRTLLVQESDYIENYLVKNNQSDWNKADNQELVFAGANQFFYYVVNSNGEMIMGNEDNPRLRPELLRLVTNLDHNETGMHRETLQMSEKPMGRMNRGEFHATGENEDLRLLIASQPIVVKGQYIGQLYIGKDISFTYQLFQWVLTILIIMGIVFFGVAVYMSVVMSKRAMVPISKAFTRQREFVGDASHELRTPLSVLLSSIDAMEMTMDLDEKEFVGRLLFNMRQEVKRMTNLVGDLLTLARSDSNTLEVRNEMFDFHPYAEKAVESVKPLAEEKEILLRLESSGSLPAVGDPERLSQLLYILLDNAIKYTPNHGEVLLTLEKAGTDLCFAVKDTGIGIRKEDIPLIFERFYRVDKSRSRQMGGHGLGLSIAKWIVDTHKGSIRVSCEQGKGTTFLVRIPRVLIAQDGT
ncbi:sensor histidine kinase [Bacillus sp. JJ1764]|uniref:sensor histidine kinase n=1 Tax=Bacillus sp. JJ1764 TaxID=3122964 RepID=UPI002FFF0E63